MNKQIEALKMAIKTAKTAINEWQKLVDDLDCKAWEKINKCEEQLETCKEALAEAEKKEWQSLSDDEIDNIWSMNFEFGFRACARAIEQTLKEKNHG